MVVGETSDPERPAWPLARWAAAGIRVAAMAAALPPLAAAVGEVHPDLALVDCGLGDPAALVEAVLEAAPRTRVVITGGRRDLGCLKAAVAAGARGWLLRESLTAPGAEAVLTAVAHGHRVLDGGIPGLVPELLGPEGWFLARDARLAGLVPREREVVRLIVMGHTVAEIAAGLGVSVKTVHAYRARAMRKLGVATRGELVRQVLGGGS